jgi:hypothetical protein
MIDDVDLGDAAPGSWVIRDSELGLDGKALFQGSNTWGDATDSCLLGAMIIYKGQEFTNFTLDVDIAASDNDGIGLLWAYTDTDSHYRGIMINDRWPDVSVDGVEGPFIKIAKRISNESPWYELLAVRKEDYVPYPEDARMHLTLVVDNGVFTLTRDDGLDISAEDHSYASGYVGFQLYAEDNIEFDNVVITPGSSAAVKPANKLATVWGAVK